MLILQGISYTHPNRDSLFHDLHLTVQASAKVALIGHNGAGKSTLLKLITGELTPAAGTIRYTEKPYCVPQHFGQFNELTVAQALGIAPKLQALAAILQGDVREENMNLLGDDWGIEERVQEAFAQWQLADIPLTQPMGLLSGGQKTKVFLAGIAIYQSTFVLLDEPTNHLDAAARAWLYDYIRDTTHTLLVVSHDRTLLNLLDTMCELSERGITLYGGNYTFYLEQKALAQEALQQELRNKESAIRKARETERAAMERQQKLNARGRKKQEKSGVPTILLNTLRNHAEKTTSRLKEAHGGKMEGLKQDLQALRANLPEADKMKIGFADSSLHKGKVLIKAEGLNHRLGDDWLWKEPLHFQLNSGERVALKGANGSGKTTLIKMMLGELEPAAGSLESAGVRSLYIDQDYSLIRNDLTVYGQAQQFNTDGLQEHEIKIRLNRFLFDKQDWDKPCTALSGGEKMRLMLCCLTISSQSPDLIILDEPTNNLDLQNIDILTAAINGYEGTLVVVSHDAYFLEEIGVGREMVLGT